jgi:hypothetical protein
MGIEQTLLEYHKTTDKNWSYAIQHIDVLPEQVYNIRSVCINTTDIQFYEKTDIDTHSSIIFWRIASA